MEFSLISSALSQLQKSLPMYYGGVRFLLHEELAKKLP